MGEVEGWDDLPAPGQQPLFDDGESVQSGLFADDEVHKAWRHWGGMPDFIQQDLEPVASVVVKFRSLADRTAFGDLIGQPLREGQRFARGIWWPKVSDAEVGHYYDKRYRQAGERE